MHLQVFVLMQFDPGMEYQAGWGDGKHYNFIFLKQMYTWTLSIILDESSAPHLIIRSNRSRH